MGRFDPDRYQPLHAPARRPALTPLAREYVRHESEMFSHRLASPAYRAAAKLADDAWRRMTVKEQNDAFEWLKWR